MSNKKSTGAQIAQMLSLMSQLGIMMVVSIFGCFFIGKFIDDKLNTEPIFMLIFLVLGVGGAFMSVYKTVIGYTKRK
ncbi:MULTISPECIES: AtpZ/AtpI family protein [Terrisporobacter]|uniref:F0F1-ATPase subunit n=3 Tax=Terrisporobacter TaxID=1505652 RepID=A0ABY9Q3Y6_9FIRM|nr:MULTISPECIES: AtpZ/AtpI family protein [Terrisporobacter]MBN9647835.1 AtpZ/AtpI family protein [Terrisporobacter glycolicus]MDU4861289.1 AtpZ/AtpI family protein [Terrisporobacter othiniensis]MCC3869161.1 AtpZ/AtpI family protein [Terrisporobacter mayombei]MDU6994923.1 AtpZ/AtpI family protein [Terrisporobacter othiniensis]UEL49405.1 AtpZ/AtpI family protein [Terrisporobacter hibernicus]